MHQIRLREPWKLAKQDGPAVYHRRFNCPTGLAAEQRVDLRIELVDVDASNFISDLNVRLNGNLLQLRADEAQPQTLFRAPIHPDLQPHNELEVEVPSSWLEAFANRVRSDGPGRHGASNVRLTEFLSVAITIY